MRFSTSIVPIKSISHCTVNALKNTTVRMMIVLQRLLVKLNKLLLLDLRSPFAKKKNSIVKHWIRRFFQISVSFSHNTMPSSVSYIMRVHLRSEASAVEWNKSAGASPSPAPIATRNPLLRHSNGPLSQWPPPPSGNALK